MAKNLVVFCDGTGNELKAKGVTNVLRLHGLTSRNEQQLTFYQAGIGTRGSPQALTPIGRGLTRFMGLGFGYGLKSNIIECYTFLMRNWEPGDRIFLFGFSRGAYTVRALAGMLSVIGLLRPDQENMVPYALKLFWHRARQGDHAGPGNDDTRERDDPARSRGIDWRLVRQFVAQFSRADFNPWGKPVRFLGVWDTVKSVGWFRRRLRLPYTARLRNVETIRHACALDEWRGQYKPYIVDHNEIRAKGRDIREVWFAGVHSDVGGGFDDDPELGRIAMSWIGNEAVRSGLMVDEKKFAEFRALPRSYAEGKVHAMGKAWVLAGVSRRRLLPADATVHESVTVRMTSNEALATRYRKKGVTDTNPIESWDGVGEHGGPQPRGRDPAGRGRVG